MPHPGSMGTLVVLLVWMDCAAAVFSAGALVASVIDERARDAAYPPIATTQARS